MMKFLGVGVMLSVVMCCDRMAMESLETRTKIFELSGEPDTKVIETGGLNFSWSTGDPIKYYNLKSDGTVTSTAVQSSEIKSGGLSSTFGINYVYPTDKSVVSVFLGSSLASKTVSSLAKDRFTLAGGIPATQDGTILPYMVSAVRGDIEASTGLSMKHMQTFISFSLNSNHTVTGTFDKIVISNKGGGVEIAGDATYVFDESTGAVSSCSIAGGGSGTITISGEVVAGKVYYAAVCPVNFTNGLRVALYKGSTILAYANTSAGNKLTVGKVNDLGTLDFKQTIPGNAAPEISPQYSSICNQGGWNMTKKLWASFTPSDCTGITWKIVKAGTSSTSYTTNAATIASSYGTISAGGKETHGGKEQFTATVTPKCAKGWLLVKATLDGDDGYSGYALVLVDDFIDIGSSTTLWARSHLVETSAGASTGKLCANTYDRGSRYMWGWVTENLVSNTNTARSTYSTRWGGEWPSGDSYRYYSGSATPAQKDNGGKYNKFDGITQLVAADDVCTKSNSNWHIPTWAEVQELTPDSRDNQSIEVVSGITYFCYQSKFENFSDVKIIFPMHGFYNPDYGPEYHSFYDFIVLTSTLYTDGDDFPGWPSGYSAKTYSMAYWFGSWSGSRLPTRWCSFEIRPVRKRAGWYPTIGTAPYKE